MFLGFGDSVNCDDNWKVVERYVDEQFNQFFQDESGVNRKNIQDNRVHCCLYFIPPYGHGYVFIYCELFFIIINLNLVNNTKKFMEGNPKYKTEKKISQCNHFIMPLET